MGNTKEKNELPKEELNQVAGGTISISGMSDQSKQYILREICPFCHSDLKDKGDSLYCSGCDSTFVW